MWGMYTYEQPVHAQYKVMSKREETGYWEVSGKNSGWVLGVVVPGNSGDQIPSGALGKRGDQILGRGNPVRRVTEY